MRDADKALGPAAADAAASLIQGEELLHGYRHFDGFSGDHKRAMCLDFAVRSRPADDFWPAADIVAFAEVLLAFVAGPDPETDDQARSAAPDGLAIPRPE